MDVSFFMLASVFAAALGDDWKTKFIKDYYRHKNVNQVIAFGCLDYTDQIAYTRRLHDENFRFCYFDVMTDADLQEVLRVNYYKLGVMLDYDCVRSSNVFDKFISAGLKYNDTYNWLIFTKNLEHLNNTLKRLPLTLATELTAANEIDHYYILYDVYNPSYKHGMNVNVTYMGYWNENEGLKTVFNDYKYVRRGNLHGMTLNSSVVANNLPEDMSLEEYLLVPRKKHLDTMIRYNYGLLLQLKDMYNFSMQLIKANTWGYLINGTFNGVIGDMIKGITDVSVAPILVRTERLGVVDYTVQSYIMRGTIFLRHPKKNSIRNVFLMPFTQYAWYAITAASLVYWTILWSAVIMEKRNEYVTDDAYFTRPYTDSVFSTVAAVAQQGISDIPTLYSGRVVCLSLFVWSLLLFQFYSASIVGSLLAEPLKFMKTLRDLANSNLGVGIHDIAYMHNFFRMTTDPDVKYLEKIKISANEKRKVASYYNINEGPKKVKAGGFAFYMDPATGYRLIKNAFTEDEICDLVEIQLHPARDIGTALPKGSPFKTLFTYGLRKVIENGMTKRLYGIWHYAKPQCPESHSSTPLPVQLQEFSPTTFLLAIGVGLATMILIGEVLYRRKLYQS